MDGRAKRRIAAMRRVQAAALDLIEARGYEAVTVEEIAAAAGLGPATVYRNFGTKERLILWDEYDPMLFDALSARLPVQPLTDAILSALVESLDQIYAEDGERILRRARLLLRHPRLGSAAAADGVELRRGLSALLLAADVVRSDLEADVLGGAIVAALQAAVERWVREEGRAPLRHFLRQAILSLSRFSRAT